MHWDDKGGYENIYSEGIIKFAWTKHPIVQLLWAALALTWISSLINILRFQRLLQRKGKGTHLNRLNPDVWHRYTMYNNKHRDSQLTSKHSRWTFFWELTLSFEISQSFAWSCFCWSNNKNSAYQALLVQHLALQSTRAQNLVSEWDGRSAAFYASSSYISIGWKRISIPKSL